MSGSIEAVTASLRTDTGIVRERNEDFVGSWEPTTPEEKAKYGWLYIVADGVGGADAGDIASQHATEQTIRYFVAEEDGDIAERLRRSVLAANDDLRQLASQRNRSSYMATTIVAAAIQDNHLTFANVGDSRGYHMRNGTFKQITKDQSLVAQLLEEGAITEEEAANHPRRNVILSSLGPTREPRIDLFDVVLDKGDVVLMCSDGLNRHVSDDEIATIIRTESPDVSTRMLIDLARQRGGSDNISVAVLSVDDEVERHNARVVPNMSQELVLTSNSTSSSSLWAYALVLCLVEVILIFIVWYLLKI